MARFRDSRGRFITSNQWFAWYGAPRDSRGRFKHIAAPRGEAAEHARRSYASAQGWEKRRRSEAARRGWQTRRSRREAPAREYSARRAAEIAAEYERAVERFPNPRPAGVQLRQHQDAWGLQAVGSVNVEPGAHVDIKLELYGQTVYQYNGRADEFAPMELRRALDEWSVSYMGDEAHYWRAPELPLWRIDKTLNPQTLKATSISVYADVDAGAMLRDAIDTHGEEPVLLTGERLASASVDWPEEEDALPE